MHELDKVWVGGVWLVYSACNVNGPAWRHAINIYIYIRIGLNEKINYIYIHKRKLSNNVNVI